jgi:hypothetical protein
MEQEIVRTVEQLKERCRQRFVEPSDDRRPAVSRSPGPLLIFV